MAEQEVNTIAHLLEMEQKASALTLKAQEDADKIIALAKAQADSEFKAQYEKIINDCEQSYNQKISELQAKKESEISSYKNQIKSSKLDNTAFNSFLDSVLFA